MLDVVADYSKTGKSKTALIKCYNTDLDASQKWRKDEQYEATWRLLIDLYRGKQFTPNELALEDKIMVNIAFSTKNVIAPSVSINYPQFSVLPRLPQDELGAEIAEQGLNYWWRRYRFHPEVRRAVDDWIILGHGWVKVGYRYETAEQPIAPEVADRMLQEQMEQVDEYVAETGDAGNVPSEDDVAASLPATEPVPVKDEPFVERVSPFDIFVDPEAIAVTDLRWICQKIVMPVDDVKKNPAFKKSVRSKVEADSALNPRWRDDQRLGTKVADSLKRVTIYEFYDLANGLFSVFCKDADDFLVEPRDLPYVYGNPFIMLRNYDVPDEFYPLGDLEMIEPIQRELNETRSDMMNHRKRYRRAWIAKRQHLDQQARDVLESNEDNRIAYIDDDVPLTDVIAPLPVSSVDAQMYGYTAVIEGDVELVSGVSEYQRGAMSETRRTATEAAMIQDAVNARSQDKLSTIEIWLGDVAEHVLKLMQTFLVGEQMIRIVGEEGVLWQPFTREQILGEFDFEVEAGSTQPRNETQRRQQAMMLFQTVQPFIGSVVNPVEIANYLLKEGFGIKDPERFMIPQLPMGPGVGPDGQPADDPSMALPQPGPNMDPRTLLDSQQEAQVA